MCLSSVSFEFSMTCVQRSDRIRILSVIDGEARKRQFRLVGVGRARKVLDQAVGDLPRLSAIVRAEARTSCR